MKKYNQYIFLITGSILYSIYVSMLLVPNKIGTGGITGIAIVLNHFFSFKIGLVTIILNIPLFIFGFRLLGKKFAIKSGIIVLITSFIIDYISSATAILPLEDKLVAAVFAGVLSGAAMSLIFMGGGSTGGFDISGKIIKNKFPSTPLSSILLIQDLIVFIFIAFTLGINSVIYAVIMSFVRAKTIEGIQEGFMSSRQCFIVSDNCDILVEEIKIKLGRGVTIINAEGGYNHTNKKLLFVVVQKSELKQFMKMIEKIDPKAFLTISAVNSIHGNFKQKFFTM